MKKEETPDVLKDEALNRFITGILLDAREQGDGLSVSMTNTLIERTVKQMQAFFPGAYTEEARPFDPGWTPDRIGA